MVALLTGVGYIGAELARCLLLRGEPVVGLDDFSSTPRGAVPSAEGLTLIDGDVADPAAVRQAFDRARSLSDDPPGVYHLAAQPSAALAEREPLRTERSNLTGARVLLEAARERGAGVVFGGSSRVYGDDLAGQVVTEDTPYGRVADLSHLSKVYVEQLGRMLGLPFVSVRLGIAYGRAAVVKTDPWLMTVPNLFCLRAVRGQPLTVLVDRPLAFIHVVDAARALLAAGDLLGQATTRPWQVVNAAPEVSTIGSVAEHVRRLGASRRLDVRIENAQPSSATFTMRSRLDRLGFEPRRSLADGLAEMLSHFLVVEGELRSTGARS
ncbi:MAG: NAD(P)-dependent oxidoreductase [Chloroflexi bacterium]|nr:NAD(P)-dependent oxidoreductase [Chloroflexota bacterium]